MFGVRKIALSIVLCVLIAGCAIQPMNHAYDPPGFLLGVFHGATILFSLIGSIFLDIRIYAFPNSGFFYDLGYFIGILIWITLAGAS